MINILGGFLTFFLMRLMGRSGRTWAVAALPVLPCAESSPSGHPAKAAGGCGVPVSLGAAPALCGARNVESSSAG